MLITQHNTQVEVDRRITLRTVTVVDPNDYIYRASNEHPTTLSEIRQKLVETLGGYLVLERAGATLYLDYLAEPPRVNTQVIRFGENLMTSNKEIRGEELASVIIPLGARLEGTGAGERLTIKSVNGGLDYLVDVTAKEQFGAISQTRVYDDITLASNLKAKGELALADAVKSVSAITVSAIDLSLIDRNIDEFRIMDKVKVVSDAQGLDDEFIIESLTLDLLSPENNKLTVGKEYKSITQNIAKTDTNITQILNTYTSSTEALRVAEEVTAIVDEISQLIKIIDRRVDPNGWYYTEYSDGMVECYKTVVIPPISVWTSDQGGYKAIVDLGLPPSGETMTFRDHIQHSLRDGGRMLTVDIGTIGLPTDEITGTVYSLVDTPSTDIYISVTLIGRK
jgi:uncharacterized ubiquitin-like protein YukD